MRRLLIAIAIIAFAVLAALAQHAFIAALGQPWSSIDLPLFMTLFALSVFDDRVAFGFFVITSIIGSFIASVSLFTPLLVGIAVCMVINELVERFFTNRTYYAVLAIGGIGWCLYYGLLSVCFLLFRLLDSGPTDVHALTFSVSSILTALGGLIAFLTISYVCTVLLSKRIRSYFIVADRF